MNYISYFINHHSIIITFVCLLISIIILKNDFDNLLNIDNSPEYNSIKNKNIRSNILDTSSDYIIHTNILLVHIPIVFAFVCVCILILYATNMPRFSKLKPHAENLVKMIFIVLPIYMCLVSIYLIYAVVKDYQTSYEGLKQTFLEDHRKNIVIVGILMLISTYELFEYDYRHYYKK